jgi:hypothetical protein
MPSPNVSRCGSEALGANFDILRFEAELGTRRFASGDMSGRLGTPDPAGTSWWNGSGWSRLLSARMRSATTGSLFAMMTCCPAWARNSYGGRTRPTAWCQSTSSRGCVTAGGAGLAILGGLLLIVIRIGLVNINTRSRM